MSLHHALKSKKRVTFKVAHPNAKIEEILKDFYSQIVNIDKKTALKIEHALQSLSKYPLPLSSGSDCAILQGFDKRLCEYINEQITFKKKKIGHDIVVSQSISSRPTTQCIARASSPDAVVTSADQNIYYITDAKEGQSSTNQAVNNCCKTLCCNCNCYLCKESAVQNGSPQKERKQKRCNSIEWNSGSKHDELLIALFEQQNEYPHREALTRSELFLKAEKHFHRTSQESDDTGHILELLVSKERYVKVQLKNNIKLYSLTNLGFNVGQRLRNEKLHNNSNLNDVHRPQNRISRIDPLHITKDASPHFIDMPPGTYDVILLVDKNEPKLPNHKSKFETRSLKVGDIMWVARSKTDSLELVLPFILERKRIDDFAASIKDGRFHEQKFRLRKCGLRNVIYLVEDYMGNKRCGLPMSALQQAMVNTRVQDGFMVHHTRSLLATTHFVRMMSNRMGEKLQNIHLRGSDTNSEGRDLMTFEYFNSAVSKTKPLTVKELFIKMLLQLRGLSVEKALAVTSKYSTPKALMVAYDNCSEKEGQLLLADLKFSSSSPRVGPSISKILYMLFTKEQL